MHRAARAGHVDAVRTLVAAGASVCVRDAAGRQPLSHAAERARAACVCALLELGAGAREVDGRGRSALEWAQAEGTSMATDKLLPRWAEVLRVLEGHVHAAQGG